MFIAALFVGLLTAYYFGIRAGGMAAMVALGLFMLAATVPVTTIPVYVVVAAGTAGVCVIGPRRTPPEEENNFRRLGKRLFVEVRNRIGKRS
jgi:hypothetical protein